MHDRRKWLRLLLALYTLAFPGLLCCTGPALAQATPPGGARAPQAAPSPRASTLPSPPPSRPGAPPRTDAAPAPPQPSPTPPASASPYRPALPEGPLFQGDESVYTQQGAIDTAIERSPVMKSAFAKVDSAVGSYLQQQSNKNLQFVFNSTSYAQPTQTAGIKIPDVRPIVTMDTLSNQFSAMLQVLITTFGHVENKIAASFLQIDVARRNADVQQRSLVLTVKQAFFNHLKAVASQATARLNLENCLQTLDDSRQMFRQGLLSRYDVVQAELRVTEAEQRLAQGGTDVQTTRASYLTALYLPEDLRFRLMLPNPVVISPTITLDQLKALAVENRPELQSLDRQLAVARKLLLAAERQSLPVVNASFGYQTFPGNRQAFQDNVVLQLTVSWAAADGGLRKAQVASARADLKDLEAQIDQQRVQVRLQVEQAWLGYQQVLFNLRTALKQVESSTVYYDMARQRYLNSLGTSLETQDALRSLNEARINLVATTFDQDLAFAQIEQALGVDFPDRHLVLPARKGGPRK